jgi:LacI family transcriptional regulator
MENSQKRRPTLKQIAELSGFSQASVSMILNGRSGVSFSAKTVRLVQAAAEKLCYVKKHGGEGQRQASLRGLVAVFCPNTSNPYYSTLVQSIEQSARERNFHILTMNTFRSAETERRCLAMLKDTDISGIIFAMPPQVPELLEKVNESIPAIVIGDKGAPVKLDTVEMDSYSGGVLIARHLVELGHRHIAYVSTTLDSGNSIRLRRLKGLEESFRAERPEGSLTIRSTAITPDEELRDLHVEHRVGFELARECLADDRITAFVAVNDMVAYGVIDALISEGLDVPGDYSVCGFDNVFPSALFPISLTSVDHYIVDKGHNAFNMLASRMDSAGAEAHKPNVITRVEYPPRLIVRGSTAPARRGRPRSEGAGA